MGEKRKTSDQAETISQRLSNRWGKYALTSLIGTGICLIVTIGLVSFGFILLIPSAMPDVIATIFEFTIAIIVILGICAGLASLVFALFYVIEKTIQLGDGSQQQSNKLNKIR